MARTVCATSSSSTMSVKATSWPVPAKATAIARPMPRRAPVTRATGRVIACPLPAVARRRRTGDLWLSSQSELRLFNVVRRPKRQRSDRQGRVDRGRSDEGGGVCDEQVLVVEGTTKRVERGGRRIIAEPDRAALVGRRAAVEEVRQDDGKARPPEAGTHLSLQPVMGRHVGSPPVEDDASALEA